MNGPGLRALVLGGSGEIGRQLVQELINSPGFSHITLVTRRELDVKSEKVEQKLVDLKIQHIDAFTGTDVAYSCLGTTRGKAGAKGFVRVDRDYVYNAAKLLKDCGCSHFHLVSSTGANKNSHFLYQKTKGEVENMVTELNFPRLSIYRPSLLLCDRQESRPMEKIAQIVLRGFDWRNKISIGTDTVASAMVANTLEQQTSEKAEETKVEILENADILRLGID
nr:oxidoreductase HTATIP2-like [Penaeus vannamei]